MRMVIGVSLAAACLAAPSPAAGQAEAADTAEAREGVYVALLAGTFFPVDHSLEGFHDGLSVEGALGYAFSDKAALELAVGQYGSSTGMVGPNWLDLGIAPVTLSLKVLMPAPGVALFVDMGLGAYFTRMHGVLPLYAGSQVSQAVSGSDRKLGVHFGAGAEFFLGRRFGLLVDLRYAMVSSTFFELNGGGYLNGVRLSAGLLFRFGGGAVAGTDVGGPSRDSPGP